LITRSDGETVIERVIVRVADPRDYFAAPGKGQAVIDHLNQALEPDGYAVTIVNGKPALVPRGAAGVVVTSLSQK
jgi:hypothetical protein